MSALLEQKFRSSIEQKCNSAEARVQKSRSSKVKKKQQRQVIPFSYGWQKTYLDCHSRDLLSGNPETRELDPRSKDCGDDML